ncbi:tetratricopeptide repeat protein [Maritalea mediterranea]|uniref:Tetratricopeptide repeat protein n=1 Tax=Maritalea mediterranea TaxID=2909667 RepID=A0ABS9EBK9_9HYPH|nr:hypothetical protein [Maritalea mediterranea]MCF4098808.1 hypothetical protein [Maritalea mediterranea]
MVLFKALQKGLCRTLVMAACAAGFAMSTIPQVAVAQNQTERQRLEVVAQGQEGFGRIILTFVDRLNLPSYSISTSGGVMSIEFSQPIDVQLPDVTEQLGEYVAVARVDPDYKGIRFGLKRDYRINRIEAGERLFVDFIPRDWQGLDPALPEDVVAELALRAERAAKLAEQRRKERIARESKPNAIVRVGRHPTFTRVKFQWTIDTEASWTETPKGGTLRFEWPIDVDLYAIQSELPEEIEKVEKEVTPDGLMVRFELSENVEPRFFKEDKRNYTLDLDFSTREDVGVPITEIAPEQLPEEIADREVVEDVVEEIDPLLRKTPALSRQTRITPFVNKIGGTVRLIFPFEQDTPAAVFKRGETVWMVFDTHVAIDSPADMDLLGGITSDIKVNRAGETQIVEMKMNADRLATLGSEGRSWVLSLGDILIAPTEPMTLTQQAQSDGRTVLVADILRPARVHQMRDPNVGDLLQVVTAYPPSRAIVRDLEYVDFKALRAVHGLVVQPHHSDLELRIEGAEVVIDAKDGLLLSSSTDINRDEPVEVGERVGYLDLSGASLSRPNEFVAEREEIMVRAAEAEGKARESARVELARYYLANKLMHEALGVLRVWEEDTKRPQLADEGNMLKAAASVLANRHDDALEILLEEPFVEAADAIIWRTISRSRRGEYEIARNDALLAEEAVEVYPLWVANEFYFAAARAAVETGDSAAAIRYLGGIDFGSLNKEDLSRYDLLAGRVDEVDEQYDEALETYGSVLNMDVRPTYAEAVYRTLLVLEKKGNIDLDKAVDTLSIQSLTWRGGELGANIQELYGRLQFKNHDYRGGFETLQRMQVAHQDTPQETRHYELARKIFEDLFLNGEADRLEPVRALGLYYDFRKLTPSGAKGDEMIRNLARRLVRVDLLDQAAELLDYQIENRLEGVARSKIAADLAVIQIANRRPDLALKTLYKSRLANLVPQLERQRRILEAKALIDAGRDELAVDILRNIEGFDARLLEVDAHWSGRRYREAGELIERIYADQYTGGESLPTSVRNDLVKAAVAYTLGNDEIGLTRLRAKFSNRMASTPEWPVFEFVTSKTAFGTKEFKALARQIADVDSLNSFLAAYRERYGTQGALSPDQDIL